MMNILIITSSFDLTVDYFIEKFRNRSDFYRLNMDLFSDYEIKMTHNEGFSIKSEYWTLKQDEIDSIYYRKPSFPDMSNYDVKYHRMMQKDMLTLVKGIADSFDGRCLSKPSILSCAENKVYQLCVANAVGFITPKTLISNSSSEGCAFCNEIKSIIKPLSIGKVYSERRVGIIQTNMVDECYNFDGLELSPTYFQEYVIKDYEVRATIINKNVYSVKIEASDKVDWRKSESRNLYSVIEIPKEIEDQCFQMMDKLNLKFGAFDFIVNNDKYYFLEINPNGQWYWLEEALNLNISESIFNYLAGME